MLNARQMCDNLCRPLGKVVVNIIRSSILMHIRNQTSNAVDVVMPLRCWRLPLTSLTVIDCKILPGDTHICMEIERSFDKMGINGINLAVRALWSRLEVP